MALTNSELLFVIKMKDEATKVLDRHGRAINKTGQQYRKTAKATKALNTQSMVLTRTLSRMRGILLTIGAGVGLASGIKLISEFGTEMSTVGALTGATGETFKALEDQARQLGATTVLTATEAAGGMVFLARAGFTTAEIMKAIPDVLNLAVAGALDLARAGDIVSNVMRGFGVSADETSRFVDVLAKAAASSNTTVEQLGTAMSFAAPVAKAFGVSIEETAAAVGVLSNAGIQAERAGTGLRNILSTLALGSSATKKALKNVGLTLRDVDVRALGLSKVMKNLAKSGFDVKAALEAAGKRGGPAMEVLLRNIPELERFTQQFNEAGGFVKIMADRMKDNLAGDAKAAASAMQELVLATGESGFTGALREALQGLTGFLRASGGAASALGGALGDAVRLVTNNIRTLIAVLAVMIVRSTAAALISGVFGRVLKTVLVPNLSLATLAIRVNTVGLRGMAVASALARTAMGGLALSMTALGAAMAANPFGAIVIVIAAAAAAVVLLANNTDLLVAANKRLKKEQGDNIRLARILVGLRKTASNLLRAEFRTQLVLTEISLGLAKAKLVLASARLSNARAAIAERQGVGGDSLRVQSTKAEELGVAAAKALIESAKKNVLKARTQLDAVLSFKPKPETTSTVTFNTIPGADKQAKRLKAFLAANRRRIASNNAVLASADKNEIARKVAAEETQQASNLLALKLKEGVALNKARASSAAAVASVEKKAAGEILIGLDKQIEKERIKFAAKNQTIEQQIRARFATKLEALEQQGLNEQLEQARQKVNTLIEQQKRFRAQSRSAGQGFRNFWKEYADNATNAARIVSDVLGTSVGVIADGFTRFFTAQKTDWKDWAANALRAIAAVIAQQLVQLAITFLLKSLGFGAGGTPGVPKGAGFDSATGLLGQAAKGAQFAKGSQFANSIVDKPTAFRFGKGGSRLGVMGEAGPEAILPLRRDSRGRLGVSAPGATETSRGSTLVYSPRFEITLSGDSNGGASQQVDQRRFARRLDQGLKERVMEIFRDEQRPGGMLNKTTPDGITVG